MKNYNEFKTEYAQRQQADGKKFDQKELSKLWEAYKENPTKTTSTLIQLRVNGESLTQRLHRLRAEKKAGKDVKDELKLALKAVLEAREAKKQ